MDSVNLEVLKACEAWVDAGLRCELVTVIKTWGSSPRPEGAMLAICENGSVVGSVSGGCIEDDLIERARNEGLTRSKPEILTYGITADEAHRFGLPCGGTIELAIEPVDKNSCISELLQRLALHELIARRLDLVTGAVSLDTASSTMMMQVSKTAMTTIFGPRWRLLIIGAGQLSRFLAQIALGMDYHVTVCDPREEYRIGWQVEGVEVIHAMPDDLVIEMKLDSHSAVIALTHDPKLDDLALMEALRSEAFYVGAIGSRSNNAKRRERLLEFDLNHEQISRLHGPIGVYIGSKTPAEIAISILAEMTAVKNGIPLLPEARIENAKLAEAENHPDALCIH